MIPLPIHSYRIDTESTARLVNCYAEAAPKGAKGPVTLRRAPGITPFCQPGFGHGRGLHTMKGVLYGISGNQLYRIASDASAAAQGLVAGTELASMANNGTQLAIIVPGHGYVYSGGLAEITDSDFTTRRAGVCGFIDNYLALVDEGTGQFICSDLADFSSFDGLDFASAEANPDDLITLAIDHRTIVLVGTNSIELWENNPTGSGFPFQRIINGVVELGGAAKFGIAQQDNSVYWVASDRTFRRLDGVTPVRVSQHGVEVAWRKYARVDDARCFPYSLNGHLAVAVTFPSQQKTWIHDCTTQEWQERESFYQSAWDVSGIAEAYGKIFVQRTSTGEIGILDPDAYTEWGQTLIAQWAYQPIYAGGKNVQIHRIQMGIETGVGLVSGQDAQPRLNLEISRQGGREGSFRPSGSRSLGRQGAYATQVHWDSLGQGRDTVIQARLSAAVPLTVWDTMIEAETLRA